MAPAGGLVTFLLFLKGFFFCFVCECFMFELTWINITLPYLISIRNTKHILTPALWPPTTEHSRSHVYSMATYVHENLQHIQSLNVACSNENGTS